MSLLEVRFKCDGNTMEFQIPNIAVSKKLHRPKNNKNNITAHRYYFNKTTIPYTDMLAVPITDEFVKTNERFFRRVWDGLWREGWR
jgi:hypothetical protein